MSSEDFAALADVAARMKLRALKTYVGLRRRDAALSAEADRLTAAVTRESAAARPGDLTAALALQRFVSMAARRADQLLQERRALASELETAHHQAVRANGRGEAIELLASKERQNARQRRARREESQSQVSARSHRFSLSGRAKTNDG